MDMSGDYLIAATRDHVWAALNDPAILKQAIPGCEDLQKLSDTEMEAVASVSLGPVKAKFKGKVSLSDLDPPNSYTLAGEGMGGPAGFAKGSAHVRLTPEPNGTRLHYTVNASIGGRLAQLGQRLIDGAAKKMADDFFHRFAALAAQGDQATMMTDPKDKTIAAPATSNAADGLSGARDLSHIPRSPTGRAAKPGERVFEPPLWWAGVIIAIGLLIIGVTSIR